MRTQLPNLHGCYGHRLTLHCSQTCMRVHTKEPPPPLHVQSEPTLTRWLSHAPACSQCRQALVGPAGPHLSYCLAEQQGRLELSLGIVAWERLTAATLVIGLTYACIQSHLLPLESFGETTAGLLQLPRTPFSYIGLERGLGTPCSKTFLQNIDGTPILL